MADDLNGQPIDLSIDNAGVVAQGKSEPGDIDYGLRLTAAFIDNAADSKHRLIVFLSSRAGSIVNNIAGGRLSLPIVEGGPEHGGAVAGAASRLRDAGVPDLKEAAMAKLFASEMTKKVCFDAIQVHGGYGCLQDFPVERIRRDVRVCQIYSVRSTRVPATCGKRLSAGTWRRHEGGRP